MTKRFELRLCRNGVYYVYENGTLTDIDFDKFNKESAYALIDEVNALYDENEQLRKENDMFSCELSVSANKEISRNCRIAELEEENEQLKSTIAQLIEQNRKNNDLLLSDIRILEKALWCSGCENDYGRLKELRNEFMK